MAGRGRAIRIHAARLRPSAARAPPRTPVTQIASPGCAPFRVTGRAARPTTVTASATDGPRARSPPSTVPPTAATASPAPRMSSVTSVSLISPGTVSATRTPIGSAPSAARSDSAAAVARHPISSSRSQRRRKCTSSTLTSVLSTRRWADGPITAQSSPKAVACRPSARSMARTRSNSRPGPRSMCVMAGWPLCASGRRRVPFPPIGIPGRRRRRGCVQDAPVRGADSAGRC